MKRCVILNWGELRMKITSIELAKLCNVSRATVDRVFNNRGKVDEKTKKKILDVANAIGYRPNYIAHSLSTGKTHTLGVVMSGLNNYFFSTLLDSITIEAKKSGYATLISLYENNPDYESECILNLIDRQVDGLIVFSTSKEASSEDLIKKYTIPAVLVLNKLNELPYVSIDYYRAMYDAVNYVVSKNYTRLIFFCPPLELEQTRNIYAIKQRYKGLVKAVENHTDKNICLDVIRTYDYQNIVNNMDFSSEIKTAILCSSDIYALKIMKLLKTRGLNIPRDVGLMGFDGIDIMEHIEPSIATVNIPINDMGERAVQSLIELIQTGTISVDTTIPYTIKPGQSIV